MEKRRFTYLVLVIVLLTSMSCMAINLPQTSGVRGSGELKDKKAGMFQVLHGWHSAASGADTRAGR